MRIAVVGAGGVGGYFGGKLAQAGIDTTFIVRGATLEALRRDGLRVESIGGDFTVHPVQATSDPGEVGNVDVVLITVKAWQIPEAAANLAPLIGLNTVVVPLENGIDAPQLLEAIFGREHVAGGLCAIVSYIVKPGHVRHAAFDPVVMFGELDNRRSDRLEALVEAFGRAGVQAEIPQDIHRSMWTKFLFIAPMSAIGAVTRAPVGVWRVMSDVREIAEALLRETAAVAHANGIDLGDDAVEKTWARYEALAAESTASLQRDVMEGKPSELDAQLGAIVHLGEELGVPTPVARTVYACLLPQERLARNEVTQS